MENMVVAILLIGGRAFVSDFNKIKYEHKKLFAPFLAGLLLIGCFFMSKLG